MAIIYESQAYPRRRATLIQFLGKCMVTEVVSVKSSFLKSQLISVGTTLAKGEATCDLSALRGRVVLNLQDYLSGS